MTLINQCHTPPCPGIWAVYTVRAPYCPYDLRDDFFLLSFALGSAVLDSEFRANHESGLRIAQIHINHLDVSTLNVSTLAS
eukprot:COSAG01_NODE_27811_length_676_cov_1.216638_1_plen_81_part_00